LKINYRTKRPEPAAQKRPQDQTDQAGPSAKKRKTQKTESVES